MNNKIGVVLGLSLLLGVAGCSRQDPALVAGQGAEQQSAEAVGFKKVEPLAVTYGLARRDSSGIYMNFTYRVDGSVRHGFLRSSETGGGRIFCPTMVATAIKLGEQIEVSYMPGSNSTLYDDLVLGIRYQGRECPER